MESSQEISFIYLVTEQSVLTVTFAVYYFAMGANMTFLELRIDVNPTLVSRSDSEKFRR